MIGWTWMWSERGIAGSLRSPWLISSWPSTIAGVGRDALKSGGMLTHSPSEVSGISPALLPARSQTGLGSKSVSLAIPVPQRRLAAFEDKGGSGSGATEHILRGQSAQPSSCGLKSGRGGSCCGRCGLRVGVYVFAVLLQSTPITLVTQG